MKKKLLIGFIIFFIIILFYTVKSEATFKITNFTINCIVEENGDMEIEENIQYYTNENKNGLIRNIDTQNKSNTKNSADKNIILEGVFADGEEYRKATTATIGASGVYTFNKSGTKYEIKVFSPFINETKTITYKYKLKNVAVKYKDIAELYWNFIGPEWDCKIENVKINIVLPEEAENGTIYVYGHGADNGTFTKTRNYIMLQASDLKAYQALDARILFPTSAISQSTKVVNKNVLNKYIDQEEGITKKREQARVIFGLSANEIAVGVSAIILIAGIYLYFKYDKEHKVEKYHYYREIPCNLEPELLQQIYYGTKTKNSFWITFLNLVKKGVFRIEKTTNEVGKETEKIVFQKDVDGLKGYQRLVAKIIIDFMPKDKDEIDLLKLQAKMNSRSIRKYSEFVKKLDSEKKSLFGEVEKVPKKVIGILAVAMAALIGLIVLMVSFNSGADANGTGFGIAMFLGMTAIVYSVFFATLGNNWPALIFLLFHCGAFQVGNLMMLITSGVGVMYIPYALLFILIQYVVRIRKSCKEERQIVEQLKGLRRYLKDYSLLSEKEEILDIVIWEEYLILAIALGLNDKVINNWYEYGQMYMDSNIERSFYNVGGYTHIHSTIMPAFNTYAHSISFVSTGSSSSFSGSSGGFSGGSSSGGGGRRWRRRKLLLRMLVYLCKNRPVIFL